MIDAATMALVVANFLVMLLWMVITHGAVDVLRTGRSRGPISNLQPIVSGSVALVYFSSGLFPLVPVTPEHLSSNVMYLYLPNDIAGFTAAAVLLAREGGPYEEELRIILGELERIERQVADLLQFGRRDDMQLSSVDFGELARTTANDLRASLRASGLELDVSAEAGVEAPGDPEKLRQVLINLVENARDALTESHVGRHVSISVGNGNDRVALEVTDDGPGVDDETLEQLFEPFFSKKHEGTGLGLAIARRTVEAHGGRIEARRRPAGGMRFRIDLPTDRHREEA